MGESGELHPRSPLRPLSAWDSAISLPALWGKHHPLLVPSSPSNSGGDQTPLHALPILPGGSVVKNLPAGDTGDPGSIPGSGRSPGGGNGNPVQYSCLENPRDGGAWWAAVYGVTQSRSRPAARPSPTVGSTGQEHIWVLRPHPGGHRGPRSWGLQRGSRLHLVRGLENFKSSGPTHWACGHLSPTGQPGCGWFPRSQGN